jgi:hypothetical protein
MNLARTIKLGGGFIRMYPLQLIGTPAHARVTPVRVSLLPNQQIAAKPICCTVSGEMAQQILFTAGTSEK